ncbi:MAG: HupE/UreJ family protein, partial [Methylotetracoccus sp.]
RPALTDTIKIVTAFTLAHSLTLSAAVLGPLELPSRWVESTIALSVVLASLNNLTEFFRGPRWGVAFGFGLVHGFGFASVLGDLGLPNDALVPALAGFNLGVEAGQLAIVAAFLPLAFRLRGSLFYRRFALGYGSAAIIAIATVWLLERSLGLDLSATLQAYGPG